MMPHADLCLRTKSTADYLCTQRQVLYYQFNTRFIVEQQKKVESLPVMTVEFLYRVFALDHPVAMQWPTYKSLNFRCCKLPKSTVDNLWLVMAIDLWRDLQTKLSRLQHCSQQPNVVVAVTTYKKSLISTNLPTGKVSSLIDTPLQRIMSSKKVKSMQRLWRGHKNHQLNKARNNQRSFPFHIQRHHQYIYRFSSVKRLQ